MWGAVQTFPLLLIVLCGFGGIVAQNKPDLTILEPVVNVPEKETARKELNTKPITCTDPDRRETRVYWKSSGSGGCKGCFTIWPCESGAGSCLIFLPSQGTLDYNARSSYIVTVGCTDDRDLEVVGTVEVRLLANTPPAFTAPLGTREDNKVTATKTRNFGYEVYDVNAADLDGDPIYYTMSTDPDTGLFDIGYANGQITFSQDPRLLCDQTVDFYVTAFDKHHPNGVGPVVIDTEFTGTNQRPEVTTTHSTVRIPETTPADRSVYTVDVSDTDGISGDLFYRVKAIPERGLDLYYLDDYKEKRIRVKDALDYEYADLRTVTLTIDITDGFCDAPTQTVTIEITDVNEPPEIKPTYREISVYEGFISVDPQWTLLDPDESENHKWSLVSGGGGKFDVSEHSGVINSDGNLDIDPNKVNQNFNMKVRVEDKDGEKADAEVRITVWDKNDNVPEFFKRMYEFNANPCTKVGAVLGQVNAKDDDSEHQGNNVLVFSGASNNMTVTSMGDVILTNPCEPEGASDFALAHVTDLGQYPGPLAGVPAALSLTCGPCPSPVPATTTQSTNDTGGSDGDTDNEADFFGLNLGWIVPAILLAAVFAGLLAYLIWRYCIRACARRPGALQNKAGKANAVQPEKGKQPKEAEKPRAPTPPVLPPPPGEPRFFGFWKETYPDRDQRHMPRRDVKPASVSADKHVEEKERKQELEEKRKREMERQKEVKKYNSELETYQKKVDALNNPPPPPTKNKRCDIL